MSENSSQVQTKPKKIIIKDKYNCFKTEENINKIINCQAYIRGFLVRNNNIYVLNKKFTKIQSKYHAVISGYHRINKTPIKESVWEEINCDIVGDICSISDEANGNHVSGKDNKFDNITISNKTAKTDGNNVSISSYRLSSVCSDKDNGNPQDILNEIEKRDNSFENYSILIRNEKENSIIEYMWYIIPKDYYIFKIDTLIPKIGKQGIKKDQIIGWKSKYCDITFSMSSQLWYKFYIKDIEKYKVCSTEIDNNKSKINYSQIFNSFSNTI